MQLYKISIKFEQDGKWSDREADLEGYLVKKSESDDIVEGCIRLLSPSQHGNLRYVKGLYTAHGSLIFMQMCNFFCVSPICFCFPDTFQQGYWSEYTEELGFFPFLAGHPCSMGHASIQIEEIDDWDGISYKTLAFFRANAQEATSVNCYLMADTPYLTDFLKPDTVSQIQLHCGKW